MPRFWVAGGEYADSSFQALAGEEQRLGPFESYEAAREAWRARAVETIDNALVRFRVEREDGTGYWVVGAMYRDTSFAETADGRPEERIGPFESYDDALGAWRRKAMATIDSALTRYRIEHM